MKKIINHSWMNCLCCLALAPVCLVSVTHAQVVTTQDVTIGQEPGTDYLAFEAEDFFEMSNADQDTGWIVTNTETPLITPLGSSVLPLDTDAVRGTAVFDQNGGSDQDYLHYKLQFTEPGDYHLYMRFSMYERDATANGYGNEDSLYVSGALGTEGNFLDGDADPRGPRDTKPSLYFDLPSDASAGDGRFEGNFEWWNATTNNSDVEGVAANPDAIYTPEVGTILDWGIGARERHTSFDRIIFHKDGDLTDEDLDALISFAAGTGNPGDYNDDGNVDIADFQLMAENFNETFPLLESFAKGDQNRDGRVSIADFVMLRNLFNAPAGAATASVPEPIGLPVAMTAVLITMAWVRQRRRSQQA